MVNQTWNDIGFCLEFGATQFGQSQVNFPFAKRVKQIATHPRMMFPHCKYTKPIFD